MSERLRRLLPLSEPGNVTLQVFHPDFTVVTNGGFSHLLDAQSLIPAVSWKGPLTSRVIHVQNELAVKDLCYCSWILSLPTAAPLFKPRWLTPSMLLSLLRSILS